MVGKDGSDSNVLGSCFEVTRHVVAHGADAGFASLLDEHAELLNALTFLLLLWMGGHATLTDLVLQHCGGGGGGQVDDAGAAQGIGGKLDLGGRSDSVGG